MYLIYPSKLKNLSEILGFDLFSLQDQIFPKHREFRPDGSELPLFQKTITPPIRKIFNTAEITGDDFSKTITLTCKEINDFTFLEYVRLCNALVLHLGVDMEKMGRIPVNDRKLSLLDESFCRGWFEDNLHPAVDLGYSENNRLFYLYIYLEYSYYPSTD